MSKRYEQIIKRAAAEIDRANNELAIFYNELEADWKMPETEKARRRDKAMCAGAEIEAKVHAELKADLDSTRRELERATFGGTDERYYQAVEDLAKIGGKALQDRYDRAARYGDRATMKAAAGRAIALGNGRIIDDYAATDPTFKENVTAYGTFLQASGGKGAILRTKLQIGAVHKPHKIGREWSAHFPEGSPAQGINTLNQPAYRHDARPDLRPAADPAGE